MLPSASGPEPCSPGHRRPHRHLARPATEPRARPAPQYLPASVQSPCRSGQEPCSGPSARTMHGWPPRCPPATCAPMAPPWHRLPRLLRSCTPGTPNPCSAPACRPGCGPPPAVLSGRSRPQGHMPARPACRMPGARASSSCSRVRLLRAGEPRPRCRTRCRRQTGARPCRPNTPVQGRQCARTSDRR